MLRIDIWQGPQKICQTTSDWLMIKWLQQSSVTPSEVGQQSPANPAHAGWAEQAADGLGAGGIGAGGSGAGGIGAGGLVETMDAHFPGKVPALALKRMFVTEKLQPFE